VPLKCCRSRFGHCRVLNGLNRSLVACVWAWLVAVGHPDPRRAPPSRWFRARCVGMVGRFSWALRDHLVSRWPSAALARPRMNDRRIPGRSSLLLCDRPCRRPLACLPCRLAGQVVGGDVVLERKGCASGGIDFPRVWAGLPGSGPDAARWLSLLAGDCLVASQCASIGSMASMAGRRCGGSAAIGLLSVSFQPAAARRGLLCPPWPGICFRLRCVKLQPRSHLHGRWRLLFYGFALAAINRGPRKGLTTVSPAVPPADSFAALAGHVGVIMGGLSEGHSHFYPEKRPPISPPAAAGALSAIAAMPCADLCLHQWLAALALVVAGCGDAVSSGLAIRQRRCLIRGLVRSPGARKRWWRAFSERPSLG